MNAAAHSSSLPQTSRVYALATTRSRRKVGTVMQDFRTRLFALTIAAIACCGSSAWADAGDSKTKSKAPEKEKQPFIRDETVRAALKPVATAANAIVRTSELVTQRFQQESLRMNEFLDVRLPGGTARKNLLFSFEPKLGDFFRRDYAQFPFEVRYGVSNALEVYSGLTPIVPNPFMGGPDRRWGLGMAKLGARYTVSPRGFYFTKVTYGVEALAPLGNPPVSLIDHYTHVKPYVTASRELTELPHTTFFTTVSYDRSLHTPFHNAIPAGVIKKNIFEVAPGLLYKPSQYGVFVEYGLQLIDEHVGSHVANTYVVGGLWDIPMERSERWGLPGKWQCELGFRSRDEQGVEPDRGIYGRVRWKINLKAAPPAKQ
ncbi:hypothetical protein GALL_115290 [mine drainage metagenome]|uniref:Uncharacterized protein n=1 Tax=mine drainage metagenome TaxID=410659 RepID=A0A1J5SEI2_9ZZZZ